MNVDQTYREVRTLLLFLAIILSLMYISGCEDPTVSEANQLVRERIRDAGDSAQSRDFSIALLDALIDLEDQSVSQDRQFSIRDANLREEDLSSSDFDVHLADLALTDDHSISDADLPDLLLIDDHSISDADLPDLRLLADERVDDAQVFDASAPDVAFNLDATLDPVSSGEYAYSVISSSLTNPPAVAWHPNGSYALVLNNKNTVHRFRAQSIEELASEGDRVRWRNVTFTPNGDHAILLATYTPDDEGRIYLWDHNAETLSELVTQRFSDGRYENLEYSSDGTQAKLLGTKAASVGYLAYLWDFDVETGRTNLRAHATSARCEDLAWVRDSLHVSTVAITCGHNGVDLYHLDQVGSWVRHNMNAGNTSHLSARPQGDYALAVTDTSHKLYRFELGVWRTEFSSPFLPGAMNVEFSTNGRRAMIFGEVNSNSDEGQIYEYRHDLYTSQEISPIFINNLNSSSPVYFNDVSWRPNCDQGLITGGGESLNRRSGYVIYFSVTNGVSCE